MSSISAACTAGLLAAYDFSQIAKLIDVGGAHGAMTLAIAKRYPSNSLHLFEAAGLRIDDQIQFLLCHVSVQTTERYLGCKQRIRGAVNDHIGIEP